MGLLFADSILFMKAALVRIPVSALCFLLVMTGCHSEAPDPAAGLPPAAKVTQAYEAQEFAPEHPEQFPLVAATEHRAAAQLAVTGTINPDVARTVPVISLASGRIVGIYAW